MINQDLLNELLKFRSERDWEQFHTAKNLSIGLCIEATELLEQFQWVKDSELETHISENRIAIENEIADVAMYLSYLCHDLKISLPDVVRNKLSLNRQKYPVEKARGKSTKYDRLT